MEPLRSATIIELEIEREVQSIERRIGELVQANGFVEDLVELERRRKSLIEELVRRRIGARHLLVAGQGSDEWLTTWLNARDPIGRKDQGSA